MPRYMEQVKYVGYGFNMLISAVVGLIVFGLAGLALIAFDFTLIQTLLLIGICVLVYCIVIPLSLMPRKIITRIETKVVEQPIVRTVQYPSKPIEKIVEKTVYVQKPKTNKLNIPKYDYVASTQAKTYHKHACRLSKLIKKKYRLSSNNVSTFKSRNYKSCKICIRKLRKN